MKKNLLFVLLCTCSLVLQAQTTFFDVDGIRYMIEDDHAVIARQDKELKGDFVIPPTVTYGNTEYSVTRLMSPDDSESGGGGAFQECEITSISLPASVTEIPNYTFKDCKQLSNVILNGAVTRIGDYAFSYCESLSTINLPDDVTEMGQGAFFFAGLTEFRIPAGLTELYYNVLDQTKIEYLEIPATINRLWGACFKTVETDENGQPFKRTIKMLQRDCRNIDCDAGAFGHMTEIANIDLQVPKGGKVVYQSYYPWSNMNSIIEYGEYTGDPLVLDQLIVTIDGIRYLLKDGKANIEIQPATLSGEVTIPDKVTYESVDYDVTTVMGAHEIESGGAFSYTQVTKVTLPSSIKTIGWQAFKNAQNLQEVVLNEGITEIVESAFAECPELTTINIPSTVTVLPGAIFSDCPKLKALTLPEGITKLDNNALYNSGIETLTIPSTCTSIGNYTLYLPNLKTLTMKVKEPTYISMTEGTTITSFIFGYMDQKGVRDYLSNVDLIVPLGCSEAYKVLSPWFYCKSITEEGVDPYQPKTNCVNIDGIYYVLNETINDQSETVRTATIACQNINLSGDIVIPEKVTLDSYDYDVTDIVAPGYEYDEMPAYHRTAGSAFQECQITSISLPATITSIPSGTFYGCQQLKSVTLHEGITTIGAGAFAHCTSLEEIYLPETINDMSGWYIFGECPNLKKVNIPTLVTTIGNGCFFNSGIETFIIPKNLTSIGESFFGEFDVSLKSIKICHDSYSEGSISFPEGIFTAVFNVSSMTLIVPEGTKESLYSQVYPWKNFGTIIEYTDQNDEHQYNAYRVEFEEEAEEETPAGARTRAPEESSAKVTVGFTPSGVAPELPTEIEKDGKKYSVTYKETLTTMPANDVVLKVALTLVAEKGDIDGDGELSVTDVVLLVNAVMNSSSIDDITQYDMDGDGDLSVTDVVLLVNLVMNN